MPSRKPDSAGPLAFRFVALMLALGTLGAAGLLFVLMSSRGAEAGSPSLSLPEKLLLGTYLSVRAGDLSAPAGTDPAPVVLTVGAGESAAAVAGRLASLGLVRDASLLGYYLRYNGFDSQIEAGDFVLRQTMTIPEVAGALTDAQEREIAVRITEGWRLEQIAAALASAPGLGISQEDFLSLAGPSGPRVGGFSFLGDLPHGTSLEGFLFPDTYFVRPGTPAPDIIQKMLANFEARLPADFRAQVTARGLTLFQGVTLASLIEREAAVDDERPLVASVIYNRLAIGQRLEIDATVQYAVGAPSDWWPVLSGLNFRAIENPYNTYYVSGLPAGPIANPGLASLEAAAQPAQSDYYFYRALCDGSHRHAFARTYEEHLANACQ